MDIEDEIFLIRLRLDEIRQYTKVTFYIVVFAAVFVVAKTLGG